MLVRQAFGCPRISYVHEVDDLERPRDPRSCKLHRSVMRRPCRHPDLEQALGKLPVAHDVDPSCVDVPGIAPIERFDESDRIRVGVVVYGHGKDGDCEMHPTSSKVVSTADRGLTILAGELRAMLNTEPSRVEPCDRASRRSSDRPCLTNYASKTYRAEVEKEAFEGLPSFTDDGVLPEGDWLLTLEQLRDSHLVKGSPASGPGWDADWRSRLIDNLEILVRQLWIVGIEQIFIDGSFAEDKAHPNDIDGYFDCDARRFWSGELQEQLNALDSHRVWTWDPDERRPYRGYPKRQLPMWHQYRVELYPHTVGVFAGLDRFGNALELPSWFRISRRPLPSGREQKGIIQLRRSR